MTIFVDTLSAKKYLVKGKSFTEKQAETLIGAFKDATNDQVVSKADLEHTLNALESRLKLYILTNNLAVVALILAAIKYL